MKKRLLSVVICLLLASCFFFTGCTSLNLSGYNFNEYVGETTENETIKIENNASSTQQDAKTKIAESYVNISFTILVAKETNVKKTNGTTVISDTTDKTFASFGSGTVVYKGGYIVTNYHVIANALSPASVTTTKDAYGQTTTTTTSYKAYASQDGGETYYECVILWSEIRYDLAIINCEHFKELPAAPMKDRSVYCSTEDRIKILEEVITIGTQYDEENYASATTGTISSSLNRSVYGSDLNVNYEYLIQHNASINHGNSGGALIDLDGNLIGVNTLGIDNANSLFYAVSIYPIISVLDTVVKNWEQNGEETTDAILGVSGIDKLMVKNGKVEEAYSEYNEDGVIVTKVETSSIIKNIQTNDIIKEISFGSGDSVETFVINNVYDLLNARLRLHDYSTGKVKVLRGEEILTLNLIK